MNRAQLLDVATRYVAWLNKNPSDAGTVATIMARNITHIVPYPGATPTFEGSVEFMKSLHTAFPDVRFTILNRCADEVESSVTVQLSVVGTHEGYAFRLMSPIMVGPGLALKGRGRRLTPSVLL